MSKATAGISIAKRSKSNSRRKEQPATWLAGYLDESQKPLASLWFVLPLLILHEYGVQHFASVTGRLVEYRVAAFTLLSQGFTFLGATGRYLPALAVVFVLLAMHLAKRDKWMLSIPVFLGMVLESLLVALPLVVVFQWFSPNGIEAVPSGDYKWMLSLYLGAGVYEELVFRLIGFAALWFLLVDVLKTPKTVAIPLIVVSAACAFSAYHSLGSGAVPWSAFVFIALRGIYYGIIFIDRGFGLSVGVHTAYDLFFVLMCRVRET